MIHLVPMTTVEFDQYRTKAVAGYAKANAAAGRWPAEEAENRSAEEFNRLLPQGVSTPGQLLFTVRRESDGSHVGVLWLGVGQGDLPPGGWIFDIEIEETHRSRGLGTATLLAAEELLRSRGLDRIGLNVFGNNPGAIALYEKLGYARVAMQMSKRLESPTP